MSPLSAPAPLARRRRTLSRLFLVAGVLLLVVGLGLGGAAHPVLAGPAPASTIGGPGGIGSGGSASANVTVNLTDAPAFAPSALTAKAGTSLELELVNEGVYNHTFTIANVSGYVFPPTTTPAELSSWFQANGSLANVALTGGQTAFLNLTIPSSDAGASFEVVSLVPYQFQAGMHGFLNVSGAPTGPGVVVSEATNDQLRFVPDQLSVNATAFPVTVDVQVTNQGTIAHTFTLEAESNNTLSPANFTQYFQAHPPLADVALNTAGATAWANFTVKAPGVFEYICRIPGHFASGMLGWLYVGVSPAPSAPPPSTAIVQEGVLVGAGALLGVGALFAVGAAYTGRFPRAARPPSHPSSGPRGDEPGA